MRWRTLALFPLLLVASVHAEDPALARIRREVAAAWKTSHVPGLSLAVVKDGKLVFAEGFGWADVAKRRRATADTVYAIGSSTKAFTALLAAQAVQEGKLSYADRPSKYLPAFRLKNAEANDKITIEDMLSHRSGLPRVDLAWYAGDFSRDELLQIVAQAEPTAPLGKRWQYQNLMFAFMGMIEERVYGKPYDALLQERFFGPLGMTHSASTYEATRREPNLATGYPARGPLSGAHPLPLKNIDRVAPAGSISSNVRDMAKYLTMLLDEGMYKGRQVFSKEAIEETRKPRIEMAPGTGMAYGLGWMLGTSHGVKSVYHGGNIDGFSAMVAMLPTEGLGVVALSNADAASLPQQAVDIVYDALGPKEKLAGSGTLEEAPASDLGVYRLSQPPITLSFVREGKDTYFIQNGQKIPLKLVGEKRYSFQDALFFTFGEGGKRAVKLEQGGMTFTLLPAEPFKAPLTVEELVSRMIAARGGADAIRRHAKVTVHYRRDMPSNAIEMYGIRWRRDPVSVADYAHFYSLGRRFAETLEAVDGSAAIDRSTFAATVVKEGAEAADEILAASLAAEIDPAHFYKKIEIVREDKVGETPVWALETMSPSGARITEYVSKTDYRVLRRDVGKGVTSRRDEFSDFRTVDGETLPFQTVSTDAAGVKATEEILSIRFDERVPEWPFRIP